MDSASIPPSTRPDSEQLVDLHVYLVPSGVWNEKYKSAYNEVITEAVSIGFVRVWPEISLWNLRDELRDQLGPDSLPEEFVYVRSVGRCLTQVKGRQELELKAKTFLPPRNFAPEIFVLKGSQDVPDTALVEASRKVELEREMAAAMVREAEQERLREEKGVKTGQAQNLNPLPDKRENIPERPGKGPPSRTPARNIVKPLKPVSPGRPGGGGRSVGQSRPGQSMTVNELKALQTKGKRPKVAAPKREQAGLRLPRIVKAAKKETSDNPDLRNVGDLTSKRKVPRLGNIQVDKNKVNLSAGAKVRGKAPSRPLDKKVKFEKPRAGVAADRLQDQTLSRETGNVQGTVYKLRPKATIKPRGENSPSHTNTLPVHPNPTLPHHYQYPYTKSLHANNNNHTAGSGHRTIPPTDNALHPDAHRTNPLSAIPAFPQIHSMHRESETIIRPFSQQQWNGSMNSSLPIQRLSLPTTSDSFRNDSRSVAINRSAQHTHSQISTATLPEMSEFPSSHFSSRYDANNSADVAMRQSVIKCSMMPQDNDINPQVEYDGVDGVNTSPQNKGKADLGMHSRGEKYLPRDSPPDVENTISDYSSESPNLSRLKSHSVNTDPPGPPPGSNTDININQNASPFSQVFSSPAPMHPVTEAGLHRGAPRGQQGSPTGQSPRKGGGQLEAFTKQPNSDSGLGEQTPEESTDGHLGTRDLGDNRNQPKQWNRIQGPLYEQGPESGPYMDPNQRQYDGPNQYQQGPHHEPYNQQQQQQQMDLVRTQRPPDYQMGPAPSQDGPMAQRGSYDNRGPREDYSAIQPADTGSKDPYQSQHRPGPYPDDNGPMDTSRRHDPRYRPSDEDQGYGPRVRDEHGGGVVHHGVKRGVRDHPQEAQRALEELQLNNDGSLSPKNYPKTQGLDSPEEPSSGSSSGNPAKQRLLAAIKDEQQERLEMEKAREELIKKAKALQGKTIDRRKKAREYWKKRYYDEKKKTPSLEEQVSKLAHQVQQQNRKLMSHLEGKGAKAPKGPPSKKMDHKIQIFRHQHDIEELKRTVDNSRMKLATEIKLRTQAETELRILKSEVTQKKINLTLKRGRLKQQEKTPRPAPRPAGRTGNSV